MEKVITFRGQKNVEYTDIRIRKEERKPELFYYEMRSSNIFGPPETIEKTVKVDFCGTLITNKPLLMTKRSFSSNENDYTIVRAYEKCLFVA